jgi:cysteinyl-tRNA synthetase
MTLRVYNTLTRSKEPFEPLSPGHVRMYVCGVTVYDECHVGHARSAIVFDVIYRYLRHKGYKVTYVRNFTDVDDKIIDRARREGVAWQEISRTYTESFHRDMDALGVLRPTLEPRATEHIPDMIRAIAALEEKGVAYCVDGNVYFSVSSFPGYGKLSRRDRAEMLAGARVEVDEVKRDPLDFALWKRSGPGEPSWESPWGPGRPGWHIECTCMSQKYLEESFDIHGGGLDLVFPHHDNEIAQAEALSGKSFARYWIHNGPLTRDGVKMSKSLGNILTISEALQQYHSEELRLFMMMAHYRKPLDFTSQGMAEAQAALDRLYSTVERLEGVEKDLRQEVQEESGEGPMTGAELQGAALALWHRLVSFPRAFEEALDDDFNTPQAVAQLFDLNRLVNQWLDHSSSFPHGASPSLLERLRSCYALYSEVLGILSERPEAFFRQRQERNLARLGLTRGEIESLVKYRDAARREKNWREADRIRDELLSKGIQLLDGRHGTTWRIRAGSAGE